MRMKTENRQFGAELRALRLLLPAVTLLLLAVGAFAQQAQKPGKPAQVLRATLDNGLRVVIVPNDLAPVVSTVVNYRVGSDEAPAGFPGMAHAQEHMMFRGSPGLSADELAAITASMGGSFDADTQQTVTQYSFTVPAEDLEVALHIESIRMSGVLDTEALWERERGAIEQEVAQDLSNPQYVMYTKLLANLFKDTAYAQDALGTRVSFDQTTGAMLKEFYGKWYAPNNAILVVAGDVEPTQALERVRALFGAIPAKTIPPRPAIALEPVQSQTLELTTDRAYGVVVVAFRFPGSRDPQFPAAQVLADVLSSRRGPLYELVVKGQALFAGFSLNSLPEASLGFAVAALPAGGDATALLGKIQAALEGVRRQGLDGDLVAAAQRLELTGAEFQKNSIAGLAMAWSDALAVQDKESPEEITGAIQRVTAGAVNQAAQQYLDLDHAVSAVLTPQPSGAPVAARGFGGAESFAAPPSGPVTLPEWAGKALGRLALPQSTVNPQVSVLPNGLTLIVQPEAISDTVSLFGHVENNPDLQVAPGQEGVESVMERLFAFGTESLDRRTFEKAVDDIGAGLSAGTDFSLEVLAGQLDRGVQLLADNQLHPAFPPEAFTILQRQLAGAVAGQLQSPDYKAGRALDSALLPPQDPALREATPATIQSLTLQDVRAYYRGVFRPDMTTIVVIGRVTPEEARRIVQEHFGPWQASGPKPEVLLPPVPANGPAAVHVPDSSRVQDDVTLAQTLGLTLSSSDRYALELGNHVLGGAFYATRLYRDLREQAGLVYYVSSSFDIGKSRSTYSVSLGCDPGNVSRARAIVLRDLAQIASTPVSGEELQQAKTQLLREIPLAEASTARIARQLLSLATRNLPLDEPQRAARAYLALTAQEVQQAFARWLDPERLVQLTQGPPPQ
jgi:zinc protease